MTKLQDLMVLTRSQRITVPADTTPGDDCLPKHIEQIEIFEKTKRILHVTHKKIWIFREGARGGLKGTQA